MRTPPLLADFTHTRACKPFCEKSLTLPIVDLPFPVIVKKLKTMEVSILIIRQERPEDYDTVYHVVKEAFENAEYTDGNEQNLVLWHLILTEVKTN